MREFTIQERIYSHGIMGKINERGAIEKIHRDMNISRFSLVSRRFDDNSANKILANEYLDFMEFLEDNTDRKEHRDFMSRFYDKQAKLMEKGLKKMGLNIKHPY